MKIVSISDTHTLHKGVTIPECDVLIHSGDISTRGYKQEIINFLEWFSVQPSIHKILISGNHDFFFDSQWKAFHSTDSQGNRHEKIVTSDQEIKDLLALYPNIIYLNDSGVTIDGVNFWGSPVQPWFHDWAFNRQRGEELKKHWDLIPDNTNVLITHGPPFGYGDYVLQTGQKVGCDELLKKIRTLKELKLNQFGHIHQGYGVYEDGGVKFINASILNEDYRIANKPIITEL